MIPSIITLDEATHTYWLDGNQLTAVSALIKEVTPLFDAPAHSARVARKQGKTQAAVLKEWAKKRDVSCEKGHSVHDTVKQVLLAMLNNQDCQTQCAHAEFQFWAEWWRAASQSLRLIAIETIVGDAELGYAGTLDTLVQSSKTALQHIFDWKTNEKYQKSNDWNRYLLPPFDDLPDCQHTKYSLQTSLYALALNRAGVKLGQSYVVHLSSTACTPHRALDLRSRVEQWLTERKKRNG